MDVSAEREEGDAWGGGGGRKREGKTQREKEGGGGGRGVVRERERGGGGRRREEGAHGERETNGQRERGGDWGDRRELQVIISFKVCRILSPWRTPVSAFPVVGYFSTTRQLFLSQATTLLTHMSIILWICVISRVRPDITRKHSQFCFVFCFVFVRGCLVFLFVCFLFFCCCFFFCFFWFFCLFVCFVVGLFLVGGGGGGCLPGL